MDIANRSDVRIMSMSLGTDRMNAPMRDAVNLALSRGKILIASSGNSQQNNPGVQNYPASFPGVIGVGATQPDDNIAPFSTNGDFVDISAPGHGILSTWDSTIPANAPADIAPTHGVGFTNLSGTSMATPIVSGLVALMLQIRSPTCQAAEVQGILEASAVDLGAPGKDPVFGAGRIDALRTLQNTAAFVRPGPPPDNRASRALLLVLQVGGKNIAAGKKALRRRRSATRSSMCTGRSPAGDPQRPPRDPAVRGAPRLHPHRDGQDQQQGPLRVHPAGQHAGQLADAGRLRRRRGPQARRLPRREGRREGAAPLSCDVPGRPRGRPGRPD